MLTANDVFSLLLIYAKNFSLATQQPTNFVAM